MERDGISGRVSEHVKSSRIVDVQPEEFAYIRVTHRPYEDQYIDYDATTDVNLTHIRLGETYEISIWEGKEITDAYVPIRGGSRACERAIAIAAENDLVVWDTIVRLRPETFVWEGEGFETVPGAYRHGVRHSHQGSTDEDYIAVDRETGVVSWGYLREDALERLDRDVDLYEEGERSGQIVETEGVIGGKPRIDGSRIGVLHIVQRDEKYASIVETAARFSGVLTVEEARSALEWADEHPREIRRLREERELFAEWVEEYWDRPEEFPNVDGLGFLRPQKVEVSFEEYKRRRGFGE